MILNLKNFNDFVEYNHFKMETLKDILLAVTPGCFMAVIDLQDAYLVVPIHSSCKCFLKFRWRGKIYAYQVLPFGLSCAPQIFTKLLKPPLSVLRGNGHVVYMYIDDAFLKGDTPEDCAATVSAFMDTFIPLGFLPHPTKCHLVPSQQVEVLGFIVNSLTMTVSISSRKVDHVYQCIQSALLQPQICIRDLASVISKVLACFIAVPLGQLHYCSLERLKLTGLKQNKGNFDAHIKWNQQS